MQNDQLGQQDHDFGSARGRGDRAAVPTKPTDTTEARRNITTEQAREEFIRYLVRRGYVAKTVESYRRKLNDLNLYLKGRGIEKLQNVRREDIHGYREHLFNTQSKTFRKTLAMGSQAQRVGGVVAFFRYCVRNELMARNPAALLRAPRLAGRISRNHFTQEEAARFLSVIDIKTVAGFFDRVFFEVAYAGALRINEILEIRLTDIEIDEGFVLIHGKGPKDRKIVLTPVAKSFLRLFLEKVRALYMERVESKFLFPAKTGAKWNSSKVAKRMARYLVLADISKKLTFHAWRRSAATHLLELGADVRFISELLGHSTVMATQVYLVTTTENLRQVLVRHHPVERWDIEQAKPQGGTHVS
ncbi:MAG: tyrosine-type recombinase/integrase [Spirochaetia bacterium]|nr:tyrosine-type recombinase/integrase [Spirochaetia bacterium]